MILFCFVISYFLIAKGVPFIILPNYLLKHKLKTSDKLKQVSKRFKNGDKEKILKNICNYVSSKSIEQKN